MNKEYIKKLDYSEQVINGYFVGKQQIHEKIQIATENVVKYIKFKKEGIPEPNIEISASFNLGDSVKNKSFRSETSPS